MDESLTGAASRWARPLTVALPLLTLWCALSGWWDAMTRSAGHLSLALPLVFLYYPSGKGRASRCLDGSLILLSVAAFGWILLSQPRLMWRLVYVDPLLWPDAVLGVIAIVLVLEATRRVIGWTLVITTLVFLLYALAGPVMPGALEHQGVRPALLIEHLYLVPEGLFNVLMGIMATYLFTFLIFANLLQVAGGNRLLMDVATALGGRLTGGPAKIAIIASALMGTVTGSTTANAVTTGSVTIPLIKRFGFPAVEAAAIETAASVGGAIMPPIMGAGVFIMSEFTGIPLITIFLYSILPALLYFGSLFAYVHIKASQRGLVGRMETDVPSLRQSFKQGAHLTIPLGALLWMLSAGYTPFYSSAVAVLTLLAASWLRRETRLGPQRVSQAFELASRGALLLTVTSAAAAVVMGVITSTGLMLKVTSIALSLAQGSLFIGIVLIAFISLIVGMGLPVTMSYILVATLAAPALADLGAPLLAAHLVVFWFAQDSTITPPVCTTAFAAASLAGSPPMRTGMEAMRAAKALYLIPFLLIYSNLLSGNFLLMLHAAVAAGLGLVLVPVVVAGYWRGPLGLARRALLAVAVTGFLFAAFTQSVLASVPGLVVSLAIVGGVLFIRPRRNGVYETSSQSVTPVDSGHVGRG